MGVGTSIGARKELSDEDAISERTRIVDEFTQTEGNEIYAGLRSEPGRRPIKQLRDILIGSKKGGIKGFFGASNSSKFTKVEEAVSAIVDIFYSTQFDEGVELNARKIKWALMSYGELVAACDEYLEGASYSQAGKERKRLVALAREIAERDMTALDMAKSEIRAASSEEMASMTWDDLLTKSRAVVIHSGVSGLKKLGSGVVGSVYGVNDSEIDVTDINGEKIQTNAMQIFKPASFADLTQSDWYNRVKITAVREKMTPSEFNFFVKNEGVVPKNPRLAYLYEKIKPTQTLVNNGSGTVIDSGMNDKEMDFSSRSVATTRMAELFGIGDIVVKTQLASLVDDETGERMNGILMENSGGNDFYDSGPELWGEKGNYKSKEHKEKASSKMSNNLVKQLMQLQVFDYICGQVDRHAGNFHFKFDENGMATSIKAIDNDAAFGTITSADTYTSKIKRVFKDGELTVPIDQEFAITIMGMSENAIKLTLGRLIDKREVEACIERFREVKEAVSATFNKSKSEAGSTNLIIDKDEDWGEATRSYLLKRDADFTVHTVGFHDMLYYSGEKEKYRDKFSQADYGMTGYYYEYGIKKAELAPEVQEFMDKTFGKDKDTADLSKAEADVLKSYVYLLSGKRLSDFVEQRNYFGMLLNSSNVKNM